MSWTRALAAVGWVVMNCPLQGEEREGHLPQASRAIPVKPALNMLFPKLRKYLGRRLCELRLPHTSGMLHQRREKTTESLAE